MPWIHVKPNSDFSTILHFFGKFSSKNCHQNPNKNWVFFHPNFRKTFRSICKINWMHPKNQIRIFGKCIFRFFLASLRPPTFKFSEANLLLDAYPVSNMRIPVIGEFSANVFVGPTNRARVNGIQLSLGLENYLSNGNPHMQFHAFS